MPNPFSRLGETLYSVAVSIFHASGARVGTPVGWRWTVRDALGNGNERIVEHFKRYMRNEGVKSGQFALFANGALVQSLAFTWAEEGYRTTETDSLFRIASCSKAFATAALREAVALAGASPDDKVFALLGFAGGARDSRVEDITIEHLIAHRGGWNYVDASNGDAPRPDPVFNLRHIGRVLDLDRPPTAAEFAAYIHDRVELDFDPGQHQAYSNIGFVLVGLVIEALLDRDAATRGMSFADFVNKRLLPPLGIPDISVGGTALHDRVHREVLYEDPGVGPDVAGDPRLPATPVPFPYGGMGAKLDVMPASGGLIMPATSLAAFVRAYNHNAESLRRSSPIKDFERPGRSPSAKLRLGSMPGSGSACRAFDGKFGQEFEYAVLFNRMPRLSFKNGAGSFPVFDRFCRTLDDLLHDRFV